MVVVDVCRGGLIGSCVGVLVGKFVDRMRGGIEWLGWGRVGP